MRLSFFLGVITLCFACGNADRPAPGDASMRVTDGSANQLTSIQWLDSLKNMGRINQGQKLEVVFRFRNSGNKPLVIESVRPGCGCTVADYPKEPIAPGKEAQITGSFDSQGREGLQHKEITVTANTVGSSEHRIAFEVDVVAKKSAALMQQQP